MCECCQTFPYNAEIVRAGDNVVLDEKNPHVRNNRNGTMDQAVHEQRCVHNGYVDFFDDAGPVFRWQGVVTKACKTDSVHLKS